MNAPHTFDRGPGSLREGKIWGLEPPVRSDAAYSQITLTLVSTGVIKAYLQRAFRVPSERVNGSVTFFGGCRATAQCDLR